MSHLYKLVQNNNEHMQEAYQKWYARPVYTGTLDLNGIAELIQRNSTAKKSDALAVLTENRRIWYLQGRYGFEGCIQREGFHHHGEPEGRTRALPA